MIECPYCNSDYKADDIGRVIFREHLGEVHRLSSKESNAVLFAKEVSLEYMEEAHQWWDNNLNQHQKPWDDMNIPERSQVITAYSRYVLSGAESVDWKQFTKDFILHQEDDIHDLLERQKKNASDEEFLWDDNDYGKYKSKFLKKNPLLNEDDFERKIDGSDYYNKESKAKEDDPDFLNDPDFQGYTEDEFGNKLKSHPSQYTLSGWDWEEEERMRDRGDVDYDSLEIKASEDLHAMNKHFDIDGVNQSARCRLCGEEFNDKTLTFGEDVQNFENMVDDYLPRHLEMYHGITESKANEDSLLKVEDDDAGGVDVTVLDEWENKGSIEKAIQAGNDDKSTFTVQEESFSDAFESNNPPNDTKQQAKEVPIIEDEPGWVYMDGLMKTCDNCNGSGIDPRDTRDREEPCPMCSGSGQREVQDVKIPSDWFKELGYDSESNAVGNYQDPAINEEYDREVDQYYVNQDIPMEDPKDG